MLRLTLSFVKKETECMICIMIISISDFVNMCEKQKIFFSNETRNANLYERINKPKRSMGPAMRLG